MTQGSDGAQLGVGAERALKTIIGGESTPNLEERETIEEMEKRIRSAPIDANMSYDGCATACARIILEAFDHYPNLRDLPSETPYLCDSNGKAVFIDGNMIATGRSLYDVLKKLYPDETSAQQQIFSELTGFQWGWAANAARRCKGLGEVSNPAIIEI